MDNDITLLSHLSSCTFETYMLIGHAKFDGVWLHDLCSCCVNVGQDK